MAHYTDKPLSFQQQIELLKNNGLSFADESKALHTLQQLHSIVYVRNICAHHSRLWNKTLRIQPLFPRKVQGTFLSAPMRNDRLYYVLCIIQYLLLKVNPNTTFPARLKALLAEFPNVDISAMGFPKDWEKETIWQ